MMDQTLRALAAKLANLRTAFDVLLIREVEVFGGVPVYRGRTGDEQAALREAIAEVLELEAALEAPAVPHESDAQDADVSASGPVGQTAAGAHRAEQPLAHEENALGPAPFTPAAAEGPAGQCPECHGPITETGAASCSRHPGIGDTVEHPCVACGLEQITADLKAASDAEEAAEGPTGCLCNKGWQYGTLCPVHEISPDWVLPVTFDGTDLIDASGRVLVWDGDIGERTGNAIAHLINARLVHPSAEGPAQGEAGENPLTCDTTNIASVIAKRFGSSGPGTGLTLNTHEAHMLIGLLDAHGLLTPPPVRAEGTALPLVAGRLDRTLADFERSCLVHIEEEQRRANPDNALIAVLCDAVRLAREYPEVQIAIRSVPEVQAASVAQDSTLHGVPQGTPPASEPTAEAEFTPEELSALNAEFEAFKSKRANLVDRAALLAALVAECEGLGVDEPELMPEPPQAWRHGYAEGFQTCHDAVLAILRRQEQKVPY